MDKETTWGRIKSVSKMKQMKPHHSHVAKVYNFRQFHYNKLHISNITKTQLAANREKKKYQLICLKEKEMLILVLLICTSQ